MKTVVQAPSLFNKQVKFKFKFKFKSSPVRTVDIIALAYHIFHLEIVLETILYPSLFLSKYWMEPCFHLVLQLFLRGYFVQLSIQE